LSLRAGIRAVLAFCLALALAACAPELDWREVSVAEGGFAVLLPGRAQRESRTIDTAAGPLTMTLYAHSLKRWTMGVAYTDLPAAQQANAQLDAARDALLRNIGASKREEQAVQIGGLPGRQLYAEGVGGARLSARFLVSGTRLYQIAYVSAGDALPLADIDMFLASFRLLP